MNSSNGFLMDYSLHRVAKYLRLLGYNAVCDRNLRQNELLKIAVKYNLALVASSPSLIAQAKAHNRTVKKLKGITSPRRTVVAYDSDGESIYSEAEFEDREVVIYELPRQLTDGFFPVMVKLLREAKLCFDLERIFSRCVTCNEVLVHVQKETVERDVHPKVYEIYVTFTRCPKCLKVFWGVDGKTVVNFTSFRTLELLQRLCRAAKVYECTPLNIASLCYFRSFPRAIHAIIISFLQDEDLQTLAAVFPQLKDLTIALQSRLKLKA